MTLPEIGTFGRAPCLFVHCEISVCPESCDSGVIFLLLEKKQEDNVDRLSFPFPNFLSVLSDLFSTNGGLYLWLAGTSSKLRPRDHPGQFRLPSGSDGGGGEGPDRSERGGAGSQRNIPAPLVGKGAKIFFRCCLWQHSLCV